jgi:transposase
MKKRTTISLDLRERIVSSYDAGEGTREDLARRYRVSLGMVAKLLQQRRQTGDLRPRHRFSGRKPKLLGTHRRQLRALLKEKPDRTLQELQLALGVDCTLQAIHYVLGDMGLSYKKRRSGPANKTGRTSASNGAAGGGGKKGSSPRGSSSSTNRPPKPT